METPEKKFGWTYASLYDYRNCRAEQCHVLYHLAAACGRMPAQKTLALGHEPTVPDQANDSLGVFPKRAQGVGHHRFERAQGSERLVADPVS